MKKYNVLLVAALALLFVALLVCWPPMRVASAGPVQQLGHLVSTINSGGDTGVDPAPMSPKHPIKVVLAGGVEAHTTALPLNSRFRMDCTTAVAYDVAQSYPDGGISVVATADSNPLDSAQPEAGHVTGPLDTVTFFSSGAGTCYVGVRYP